MFFSNKSILIISPESWNDHYVSKHHYALTLSKNNKVWFLNPPSKKSDINYINDNLCVIDYKERVKGVRYFPFLVSAIITYYQVLFFQKRLNTRFDILWNFDPSRFFNLAHLPIFKIAHIVDFNQKFQRNTLAKTSDICFGTTDFIVDELKENNENSHKITHGYQKPRNIELTSFKVKDNGKVKVGMTGNLNRKCIDWDLISKITKKDTLDFYFAGNASKEIISQLPATNINWMGKLPAEQIPSFLKKMDVLICVYKIRNQDDIIQHANLHKIMEYLGSGKTVISSYIDEFKDKTELVIMVNPNEDFFNIFNKTLIDLTRHNKPKNSTKRIAYARSNSYENQLEAISFFITTKTFKKGN